MIATFKQTHERDLGRRENKKPCHPSGVKGEGVYLFELFSGLTKPNERFERTPVLASTGTYIKLIISSTTNN